MTKANDLVEHLGNMTPGARATMIEVTERAVSADASWRTAFLLDCLAALDAAGQSQAPEETLAPVLERLAAGGAS